MSRQNKRRLTESSLRREDTNPDLGILHAASPYSRQFSEPGGDWSRACVQRFSAMSVPPQALAKLHQTHELLKATQMAEGNLLNILEDTNETVIDKVWSTSSWQVMPQMPRWSKEASHAVRSWRVSPPGANRGVMLQRMGIGAVNTKGSKGHGDRSVGQDCCSISLLPSGWTVYCLFDGHGEAGHWPAIRSSKTLPYFLHASASCSTMLKQGKVKAALFHAFEKVQMDLVKQSVEEDFSLQVCGCTAVCLLQHPDYDTVWVANLGDSKAVMISPTTLGVVAETVDHKPSVASERERVERSGMELQTTIHDDGFVEERLFIKDEEFPGLCMTRSLGDLCVKQHGITAEPEIVTWDVKSYPDSYMLLATDGVWDFLSGDEVSEIVLECTSNGGTLEDATAQLLAAAKDRWSDYDESYCDTCHKRIGYV
ncbi:unnamed protein product [Durusdinium trenchii]|uniref:PPM-type phosphatase domain-containing protein n=1 Tax=Durusdinium trenchii TaxID=1381693 RepID=A0ABP0HIH2_9DINO